MYAACGLWNKHLADQAVADNKQQNQRLPTLPIPKTSAPIEEQEWTLEDLIKNKTQTALCER